MDTESLQWAMAVAVHLSVRPTYGQLIWHQCGVLQCIGVVALDRFGSAWCWQFGSHAVVLLEAKHECFFGFDDLADVRPDGQVIAEIVQRRPVRVVDLGRAAHGCWSPTRCRTRRTSGNGPSARFYRPARRVDGDTADRRAGVADGVAARAGFTDVTCTRLRMPGSRLFAASAGGQ
jgi:hypothetical protein